MMWCFEFLQSTPTLDLIVPLKPSCDGQWVVGGLLEGSVECASTLCMSFTSETG